MGVSSRRGGQPSLVFEVGAFVGGFKELVFPTQKERIMRQEFSALIFVIVVSLPFLIVATFINIIRSIP